MVRSTTGVTLSPSPILFRVEVPRGEEARLRDLLFWCERSLEGFTTVVGDLNRLANLVRLAEDLGYGVKVEVSGRIKPLLKVYCLPPGDKPSEENSAPCWWN